MIVLEIVVIAVLVALVAWLLLGARGRVEPADAWRVITRTKEDGTLVVAISGSGGERVVRELAPGLEGPELTAELRLAREEADAQVAELNRVSGQLGPGR